MSNSKALKPRAEAMFACIEKYLAAKAHDGLLQKTFCAQEGLAISTFQNWLQKYRAHQRQVETAPVPAKRFIPLHVQAPPNTPPLSCVLEFPNGVMLRLSGAVDLERLFHLAAGR